MRVPAKLRYAWIVAAVTFVVLLLTAGIRAAPGVLGESGKRRGSEDAAARLPVF